jgi:NCS2 family nucleobase:cation symporter-2
MSLVVLGIGTLLQCLTRGPIGSGYAVPSLPAPIFFGVSILAAQAGGLGLISGMTLFAGLLMVILSTGFDRLRVLLPTEVIGVIVLMVAISLLSSALRGVLAIPKGLDGVTRFQVITVSLLSFGTMVSATVFRGPFQRLGLLFGVLVGTLASLATGIVHANTADLLGAASFLALPIPGSAPSLDFSWSLAPAFMVAAIASCAKTFGDLTIFQKANDQDWVRPDVAPLRRGIMASGLGSCIAGLFGCMGMGTATTCIGLSMATRTMSRAIAVLVGVIAILLGCLPPLAALILLIPEPVKGAMVLFVVCFLMVSAFQLILSRMLDARRTFVVGTSLSLGLGVQLLPELYHGLVPQALESGLTITALTALFLNLIARLTVSEAAALEIPPGAEAAQRIASDIQRLGGQWGARREVFARMVWVLTELAEMVSQRDAGAHRPLRIDIKFNEFSVRVKVEIEGPALPLPEIRPTEAMILENDAGLALLSGHIIRGSCKTFEQKTAGGKTILDMRFKH